MKDKYIELRINRDFGDILTTYFEFLRQNIKKFTNVFLSYNGVFLIGLLITSYLLVSGFVGLISESSGIYGISGGQSTDETYWYYIIAGGVLFFLIFLVASGLNFSLSTSYILKYEEHKGVDFDKTMVWNHSKSKLGRTFLFILLLVPMYLVLLFVLVIISFIPFLGNLVQIFMTAWIGVSYVCMFEEDKGVTEALGEGWNLVTKNFWKSIGTNFILALLNFLLLSLCMLVPIIIISVFTFHIIENNIAVDSSITPSILYTVGLCLLLIIFLYSHCLSQFVNGILFYALHEKTYNVNTRSKIEQIGQSNQ